jgi:hypothetical protein
MECTSLYGSRSLLCSADSVWHAFKGFLRAGRLAEGIGEGLLWISWRFGAMLDRLDVFLKSHVRVYVS